MLLETWKNNNDHSDNMNPSNYEPTTPTAHFQELIGSMSQYIIDKIIESLKAKNSNRNDKIPQNF